MSKQRHEVSLHVLQNDPKRRILLNCYSTSSSKYGIAVWWFWLISTWILFTCSTSQFWPGIQCTRSFVKLNHYLVNCEIWNSSNSIHIILKRRKVCAQSGIEIMLYNKIAIYISCFLVQFITVNFFLYRQPCNLASCGNCTKSFSHRVVTIGL